MVNCEMAKWSSGHETILKAGSGSKCLRSETENHNQKRDSIPWAKNIEWSLKGVDSHSWKSEVLSLLENRGLYYLPEEICYFSNCFHKVLRCT